MAADRLAQQFKMQVVVARSKNIDEKYLHRHTGSVKFITITDYNYELMKYSHFGIIKSGTSTLEAGFLLYR
jgi:lipid-A-disaccharide synthase